MFSFVPRKHDFALRHTRQIFSRSRQTSRALSKPRTMLVPVTTSVWGMEYSVHACPKKHKAEAQAMFPGLDVSDLLVVPTCQVRRFCRKHATNLENALHVLTPRTPTLPSPQRTKMDIVKTGEEVDEEVASTASDGSEATTVVDLRSKKEEDSEEEEHGGRCPVNIPTPCCARCC